MVENLGHLFCDNQKLLARLGASHSRLDRVCELAATTGIGWAKLTDAGGGGCAIVLPRLDLQEDQEQALGLALKAEGFDKHELVLGAAGIGLLLPASVRTGSHGETEVTNFDAFEKAVDARSIEELVGNWGQIDQEGWLFWNKD